MIIHSQEVAKIIQRSHIPLTQWLHLTTSCQDQEIYAGTMPRPYSDITGFAGSRVCVSVRSCYTFYHMYRFLYLPPE